VQLIEQTDEYPEARQTRIQWARIRFAGLVSTRCADLYFTARQPQVSFLSLHRGRSASNYLWAPLDDLGPSCPLDRTAPYSVGCTQPPSPS
jgi:hypothetical protein